MNKLDRLAPSKPRVVVIHGEEGPRQALAKLIWQKHRLKADLPRMEETLVICSCLEHESPQTPQIRNPKAE
jgi:hypothetical protein